MSELSGGKRRPKEIEQLVPRVQRIIEREVNEASLFVAHAFTSPEKANTDFVLQIKITNYGSQNWAESAGIITACTFGLLPVAVSDTYILNATLLNSEKKPLKFYSYEDTMKTWLSIWMIPWAGNSPGKVYDSLLENMIRTLLRDLLRDEALPYSFLQDDSMEVTTV